MWGLNAQHGPVLPTKHLQVKNSMSKDQSNDYLKKLLSGDSANINALIQEGQLLASLLERTAEQKGHSLDDLCGSLMITKGFLGQLRNGAREGHGLSESLIRASAAYLEIPYLAVLILTGKLTVQDVSELDAYAGTSTSGAFDAVRKFALGEVSSK